MITTLDQDIELYFTGFTAPSSGLYNYTISKAGTKIFAGQVYMDQGVDEVWINITDILRNYIPDLKRYWGFDSLGSALIVTLSGFVENVTGTITVGSTSYGSNSSSVGFFYVNPVKRNKYSIKDWINPKEETACYPYNEGVVRVAPSSSSATNVSWDPNEMFISHYPFKKTQNYGISMMLASGLSYQLITTYDARLSRDSARLFSTGGQKKLSFIWISLDSLFDDSVVDRGSSYGKYGEISMNNKLFCKIDMCPAPYYLKWQDRYGSWNSYGFDGKFTYKEDFKKENTTNWNGVTRPISNTITSSWNLNSSWIPEKDIPHFENIFTSPYLALYDVESDLVHEVNLKDTNFEEKTYKNNGKKMVSLSFNVELAKQQLILS